MKKLYETIADQLIETNRVLPVETDAPTGTKKPERGSSEEEQFAGKSYGYVKGFGKMTKEQHTKHFPQYEYLPLKEANDGVDHVSMTVPLFIRCLEFAREDCGSDVELHEFVEKVVAKSGILDTEDYDSFLPK
jgi:hypothetical protein